MTLKCISSRHVYSGRIIELVEDSIELPSGRVATREVVKHPGAAVIIPVCEDGSVILVEQYRHPVGKDLLELPAGTLEPGEAPLECAKREVIEEAGFTASEWIELGTIHPGPGICNEIQFGFLARGLSPQSAEPDEDEILSVRKMSVPEIKQAIIAGELRDAKSMSFLFRACLMGYLGQLDF